MLSADRLFDPDPAKKSLALELYERIKDLPIISPHGHVDPALFSNPESAFGNPVEFLIQPDHYLLRMLYSQGISYDELLDKKDHRRIWQLFAEHFYLFRGTPSGLWFNQTLELIFGIEEKLDSNSAGQIYDRILHILSLPDFTPRNLFKIMNIEILATTDSVTDPLAHHQCIRESNWDGTIIPTYRADNMIDPLSPNWNTNLHTLCKFSGVDIIDFKSFIQALEERRVFFKSMGATATDISVSLPDTTCLSDADAETIFQKALKEDISPKEAARFKANMLWQMARMSTEDGMIMQLHSGIFRNHNPEICIQYGPDMGFDIPQKANFTLCLKPLLDQFGNHPNFTLILFTLDESAYSRELAPLAGSYPAVKLGPPWWFHDSWNGMQRYFDQVIETAGLYNTVGFNDDTRAFLAIPARHDLWRRAAANWLAGLVVRHLIDRTDAEQMAFELAVGLAKKAYHFDHLSATTHEFI